MARDHIWQPGQPHKFIPQGDVAEASKWLGVARRRLAVLAQQGEFVQQQFSPADGVTIDINTLRDIPRIMIEVGGVDYVMLYNSPESGANVDILGGKLLGGPPTPKWVFDNEGLSAAKVLMPLGGNTFIGVEPPHRYAGTIFIFTTAPPQTVGQTLSPWPSTTNPDVSYIFGIASAAYCGVVASGAEYRKRLAVLYGYHRVGDGRRQPAIALSNDGGHSFDISIFNVDIASNLNPEQFTNVYVTQTVFCGENRIALIGTAQDFLPANIVSITSSNGGASWSLTVGPADHNGQLTCAYIGGSAVLGITARTDGFYMPRRTYLSTDYGATFTFIEGDAIIASCSVYSHLVCVAEGSALYIAVDGHMYRTTNQGAMWEKIAPAKSGTDDESVVYISPPSVIVQQAPSAPVSLPTGKVLADYTQLVAIAYDGTFVPDPTAPVIRAVDGAPPRLALSKDGGRTWTLGATVPSDATRSFNVGLLGKSRPPFPIFPDLHKNGLDITDDQIINPFFDA